MNYGIVIYPSKEVQDYANSYRKRFDPHYTLIQPHLTLRETEDWDEQKLELAVQQLEEVSQSLAPFTIRFNRFSSFYPSNHVIYLALENEEPLHRCYEAVCQGALAETNRRFRFTPHLTIGQELGSDELHDVLSSLRNKRLTHDVKVDRLHLLYQTDNQAWTVHQTFLLRG